MTSAKATPPNLDRFKKDFDDLVAKGEKLELAMEVQTLPREFAESLKKHLGNDPEQIKKLTASLPSFTDEYQPWYSEAKTLVRQLLPDRLEDFVRHYEKPKRKEISPENYTIEDHLQGLTATRTGPQGTAKVVGLDTAIPRFRQQLNILKAVRARFDSSLFDIRQLAMADLFDSELDVARELAKNKFTRAAGAIAGVVLEKHLVQVCENHSVVIPKKNPGISDLNEALRQANVIDMPQWRSNQYMADIRNLCTHDRQTEPTTSQVDDLISGVEKIVKKLF